MRRLTVVGAALLVGGLALLAWGVGQIEPRLRQSIDKRLANSEFTLRWGQFAAHWNGTVDIGQLELRRGNELLFGCERASARLSWVALLRGSKRLNWLELQAPVAYADLIDGKPLAWQQLAATLRQNAEPQDDESGPRKTLADRVGEIRVRDGALKAKVLGKAVWLAGTDVHAYLPEFTLDTGDVGQGTLRLPAVLGGGQARLQVQMREGQPQSARLEFDPPARYIPPDFSQGALPKNLAVQARAATADRGNGLAAEGLEIVDLAGEASAAKLVWAERATVASEGQGVLTAVRWQLPQARWALPLLNWAQAKGVALPAEFTAVAASDLGGSCAEVGLAKSATATAVRVQDCQLAVAGVQAGFAHLRADVPPKGPDGQRPWFRVDVHGPFAEVPRKLLKSPKWQARIDQVLAVRKAPDPAQDDDDDDDAPPEDRPPVAASPKKAAEPDKKPQADNERPPQRMTRRIKELHQALLGLHDKIARKWPAQNWPAGLALRVTGGRAQLLGDNGGVILGVRDAGMEVDAQTLARDGLAFWCEPFDRAGSWGRAGGRWKKTADGQKLEIAAHGAGVAQVAGAQVNGLSVGDGADIDVQLAVDLKADRKLAISGRASVANMGIQWWRLAERPIADFAASLLFDLQVSPTSVVFRTPEAHVGAATLHGSIALHNLDANPRFALQLDAPMQDCGQMLRSIPPSMLPTIGPIDAHGVMDFSVGVRVQFPQVGATAVDLSLGDTYCTVDKLGNIDFDEFKSPKWSRPVNENGKILEDVQIGPGSGSWTSTMNMPGYVHYVMWATEDPFLRHRGISEDLVAKALAIDLMTGRFTYGGSSITQQLVKNLYLRRTKALSRKFEEMLIVWQMEKALGKARILEIYVNGVEFGPKIYGITRAAWEFFQKKPNELRPKEAVYLAIIKPSPRSGWGTMRANGWGDWYDMKVGKYMDKLLRDESITPAQYEADKPWKPAFNPPLGKRQP